MYNEPQLYGFLSLTLISIAFFNFSGVSITKYMSATTRKVLDTLRTMFIWVAQMLLHFADERWDMPSFKDQFWLQLAGKSPMSIKEPRISKEHIYRIGFIFVVTGIFLYSDVLIMPYIRKRKEKQNTESVTP